MVVVDDSAFVRKALTRLLADHPVIHVVGVAASGEELLAHLQEWKPDAITLDLSMPGMGGLRTLDGIMTIRPTPVIILSTHSGEGAPKTIEALHRGAMDFIDKQQYSLVDFQALRGILVEKLIEVTGRKAEGLDVDVFENEAEEDVQVATAGSSSFSALLIGASTGGPPAIQTILEDLGPRIDVPILIVQHMPPGFTKAFADRLNSHLPFHVREAEDGEALLPQTVYIAPAGQHLVVEGSGDRFHALLSRYPETAVHRPSANELFESGARTFGSRAIAALLTGMGRDGAEGMASLFAAGAHTIAQDEDSCVVFGMPRAAVALGAVREVLSLSQIGNRLRGLLTSRHHVAPLVL